MKLGKRAQENLDAHKRALECAVHDAWSNIYRELLLAHGDCPLGTKCPSKPGVIHLKHEPVNSDLVENSYLSGLRTFLDAENAIKGKR